MSSVQFLLASISTTMTLDRVVLSGRATQGHYYSSCFGSRLLINITFQRCAKRTKKRTFFLLTILFASLSHSLFHFLYLFPSFSLSHFLYPFPSFSLSLSLISLSLSLSLSFSHTHTL